MTRFSANLTFLYPDLPFLERFAAAARDGFTGVEYLGPYDFPPERIAALLAENSLEQVLFNMPPGNWAAGERGIACLPGRDDEFRAGLETALRYAKALGCTRINVLSGIAPDGASADHLDTVLVANLAYAAPRCRDAGVRLLIEPINTRDIPGFHVSRSAHAERIIDAVGSDNLFIQYDFYHMQIMQGDLVPTFERLRDRIAHVQVADTPGRNEPGTGEINYGFILAAIDALGYDGWVGCEYKPRSGAGAATGWMSAHRQGLRQ